ncbi:hypothetical protein [Devosia salina]|uniref:Uncharacterized protein n=1 Tax=Devosia salina TaxID=2860336 RepID=A0ABX8WH60_9HYPH|nr:hypothetical protein [Devosia salina]QYO76057.1 hypothetical protein K1X15_15740 [Devosia salina]
MDDRHSPRQMIGTYVFLITGPILWAINLTLIYGAQSSLCAFAAWPAGTIKVLVGAISILLVGCAGAAMLWPEIVLRALAATSPPEDQWPFLKGAMRLLTGLSALAMTYFALAALFVSGCDALR